MTTRIFISGPITGKPNLNREAFNAEERLLREAGYETFNPHSIAPPEDLYEECGCCNGTGWIIRDPDIGTDQECGCENGSIRSETQRTDEQIWRYYMRVCVGQIPLCDGMRMLPDWQNSRGSVWEHRIAKMLGLEITYCHVPDVEPKW
jgi:hypothetical protein